MENVRCVPLHLCCIMGIAILEVIRMDLEIIRIRTVMIMQAMIPTKIRAIIPTLAITIPLITILILPATLINAKLTIAKLRNAYLASIIHI